VASSLSSSDCFVLQSGNALFTWHGNASSFEQQQWAAKVAEFLKVYMVFLFNPSNVSFYMRCFIFIFRDEFS
jgi:Gelsolin repeat